MAQASKTRRISSCERRSGASGSVAEEPAPDDPEALRQGPGTGSTRPERVDGEVSRDPEDPRRESPRRVVAREVLPDAQERELGDVAGVLGVAEHPAEKRDDGVGAAANELGERILIARFRQLGEASFVPGLDRRPLPRRPPDVNQLNGHAEWFYGSPPGVVYRPFPPSTDSSRKAGGLSAATLMKADTAVSRSPTSVVETTWATPR